MVHVCVCVYVYVKGGERERERERDEGQGKETTEQEKEEANRPNKNTSIIVRDFNHPQISGYDDSGEIRQQFNIEILHPLLHSIINDGDVCA